MMSRNNDILFTTEYIENVLYFATVRHGRKLQCSPEVHYFSIDDQLIYENYYSDFGPLNIGCVYQYCNLLNDKLKKYLNKQTIVHYTSNESKKKANAAFLLACYGVLYLSLTPREALKPLMIHGQTYRPFQDATQGESMYTITISDCLNAIKTARQLNFFNFQDFNFEEYDRLDKIEGGDLNWIVPGKFLAFIGPVDHSISLYHPPEMYIDYFKANNVQIVIRLNKRLYDGDVYNNVGITHYDLFFPDGSCPPRHILMKFLQIAENAQGAIAVHCKAGLGRTGSLIGCYLIKHYRMTAHEAIGWMRLCRPGSVIGHQQDWLEKLEPWLIKQGNLYRKRMLQDVNKLPVHEFGIYSILEVSRPVIQQKPSSSPPHLHRQSRSDITPHPRPLVIRDAPSKAGKEEQYDWRLRYKVANNTNISSRGSHLSKDSIDKQYRNGGGEPRYGTPSSSRANSAQLTVRDVRVNKMEAPIPTFRTSTQESSIKSLSDAKNFLMKSSQYGQHRTQLNSALIVTPLKSTGYSETNHEINSANRDSFLPAPVRRHRLPLGRSPSPSPNSSPARYMERSRATMTPKFDLLPRHRIVVRPKEPYSGLNSPPRHGSIGAASVGAASLGASRDAPAPKRASSVRSDDRPLATQGDMLNSIKFQRRLRESIAAEKSHDRTVPSNQQLSSRQTQEKTSNRRPISTGTYSVLSKENIRGRHLQEKTTAWRPAGTTYKVHDMTSGEKTQPPRFRSPPRPTSPKGRNRTSSTQFTFN